VRREATLVPRFDGGPYGPGDPVEGVLIAREPLDRARTLTAELRFVDRSPSFAGATTYGPVVSIHEGPVAVGQEIPFALQIPDGAYPSWSEQSTAKIGALAWALVIQADIEAGLDTTTTHDIPVDTSGRSWTGPAPLGEQKVKRYVDNWDVEVTPDPWVLRRGEEVTVRVRIGKPRADRPKLEVGVLCQAFYDVETKSTTSGDTDYGRETRYLDLFEEWPQFDPSLPEQSFAVRVPEDAPFTYRGGAFGFSWSALAREKRRWFQSDAGRIAVLEVMP
jgi:hypothetical protein